MKIVRYTKGSLDQWGVLDGSDIFLVRGSVFDAFTVLDSKVALDSVTLLAPCLPTKAVCVGKNYVDHALELDSEVPEEPIIFLKPPTALAHPGGVIAYPPIVRELHYEAELAVVIKKKAKNVPRAEAYDYILGYTCANDVTARDIQRKDGQWTRAKSFDTFLPVGPCVATDLDPDDARIRLLLNGQVRQSSNTSLMQFKVDQIIAFITQVMTLNPGDIVLTGTPSGIGPMQPGDTVAVEIDGIGKLQNTIGNK